MRSGSNKRKKRYASQHSLDTLRCRLEEALASGTNVEIVNNGNGTSSILIDENVEGTFPNQDTSLANTNQVLTGGRLIDVGNNNFSIQTSDGAQIEIDSDTIDFIAQQMSLDADLYTPSIATEIVKPDTDEFIIIDPITGQLKRTSVIIKHEKTIYVDSIHGSDTLGEFENPLKPYATLNQAITDNGDGFTYIVYGDVAVSSNLIVGLNDASVIVQGDLEFNGIGTLNGNYNLLIQAKNISISNSSNINSGSGSGNIIFRATSTISFINRTSPLLTGSNVGELNIYFEADRIFNTNTANVTAISSSVASGSSMNIYLNAKDIYSECTLITSRDVVIINSETIRFRPTVSNACFAITQPNGTLTVNSKIFSLKGDLFNGSFRSQFGLNAGVFRGGIGGTFIYNVDFTEARNETTTLAPFFGIGQQSGQSNLDVTGKFYLEGYKLVNGVNGGLTQIHLHDVNVKVIDGTNVTVPSIIGADVNIAAALRNVRFIHGNNGVIYERPGGGIGTSTNSRFVIMGCWSNVPTNFGVGVEQVETITVDTNVDELGLGEFGIFTKWFLN